MYRVLLLDDDSDSRLLVEAMLNEGGGGRFALDYAPTIAQAMELVRTTTYDYHIVDYTLSEPGGETGLDFVRQLLTIREDAPIGLCTGHEAVDLGSECVELVANGTMRFHAKKDLTGPVLRQAILSASSRRIRVLVVDDDPEDVDLVIEILQHSQIYYFEVDAAHSAAQARERMQRETYDVYILDYQLGTENSTALVREMYSAGIGRPVILLTQTSPLQLNEDLVEKIGSGDLMFLSKDRLNRDKLMQILSRCLNQPTWMHDE